MAYKNLTVELFADRRGKWRWRITARNGKIVANAGEYFASKSNALRAFRALKRGMAAME